MRQIGFSGVTEFPSYLLRSGIDGSLIFLYRPTRITSGGSTHIEYKSHFVTGRKLKRHRADQTTKDFGRPEVATRSGGRPLSFPSSAAASSISAGSEDQRVNRRRRPDHRVVIIDKRTRSVRRSSCNIILLHKGGTT